MSGPTTIIGVNMKNGTGVILKMLQVFDILYVHIVMFKMLQMFDRCNVENVAGA